MKILSIETSCDETSAAVVEGTGQGPVQLLGHVVYSQIATHAAYGGVFPELASREHLLKIGPVIEQALREASQFSNPIRQLADQIPMTKQGSKFKDVNTPQSTLQEWLRDNIDAIAVTVGPGLIGSLLVGVNTAKTLAYIFDKPLIPVNHHEGHIAAAWIEPSSGNPRHQAPNSQFRIPQLPAVALVVSGGHTQLILVKDFGQFEVLGRTRDDAVGEAFDKVARLLGMPYPGGPQIAQLADQFREKLYTSVPARQTGGDEQADAKIRLPRPMLDSGDLAFSFSGLKTAVARVAAQQTELTADFKAELAHEFQEAAIEVLVAKTRQAIKTYQPRSLIVAGGVAANKRLRQAAQALTQEFAGQVTLHIPPIGLCTDNAAMIGAAALTRALANRCSSWYDVVADDNYPIG